MLFAGCVLAPAIAGTDVLLFALMASSGAWDVELVS